MHHIDVRIEKDIYDVNNALADKNAKLLRDRGVRAFDLLGAIGSGKTALIERLVPLLTKKGLRAGSIAGDVYGDDDFRRIVALGIPAFNANTGKECHLAGGMPPALRNGLTARSNLAWGKLHLTMYFLSR